MELNIIHNQNCLEGMLQLPDSSVDCCVTSPPYFGLRDYGNDQQIGLEETPELFIKKLVAVFNQVKRVLKPEGTLWLNMGDSYWGGKGMSGAANADDQYQRNVSGESLNAKHHQIAGKGKIRPTDKKHPLIKSKDLIGIPWMVAFAFREAGWYLRQDIIWAKAYTTLHENYGSTMPESVTDRFVKSHEYLFLLSKSSKYYFDIESIKKPIKDSSHKRLSQNIETQAGSTRVPGKTNGNMKAVGPRIGGNKYGDNDSPESRTKSGNAWKVMARNGTNIIGHSGDVQTGITANKRSVWHHNPSSFKEAHFATFPEDLIVDCIKAGCPENGIVLDPFMGGGTTAVVARKLNRNYIGFELNEDYVKIANNRLHHEIGIFM